MDSKTSNRKLLWMETAGSMDGISWFHIMSITYKDKTLNVSSSVMHELPLFVRRIKYYGPGDEEIENLCKIEIMILYG